MKFITILILVLLCGCSSTPHYYGSDYFEEGDVCPRHSTRYCEKRGANLIDCYCVSNESLRDYAESIDGGNR